MHDLLALLNNLNGKMTSDLANSFTDTWPVTKIKSWKSPASVVVITRDSEQTGTYRIGNQTASRKARGQNQEAKIPISHSRIITMSSPKTTHSILTPST